MNTQEIDNTRALVALDEAPDFVKTARSEFAASQVSIIDLNGWLDKVEHPVVKAEGTAQLLGRKQTATLETSNIYLLAGKVFDLNGRKTWGYRFVAETVEQAANAFDPAKHMSVRTALIFVPGRDRVGIQLMPRGAQFDPKTYPDVDLGDVHVNTSTSFGRTDYYWNSVAGTNVGRLMGIVTACLREHGCIEPSTLGLLDMDPEEQRMQRREARSSRAASAAPPVPDQATAGVGPDHDPFAK